MERKALDLAKARGQDSQGSCQATSYDGPKTTYTWTFKVKT